MGIARASRPVLPGPWFAFSLLLATGSALHSGPAFAGPLPTKLGFIVEPSDVVAGNAIAPAVQVALQANNGSTVTTATDTVTIGINFNPEGGTLSGTLSVAAVNGVATFNDLRINRPGVGYTLWAYSGTLIDATSVAFEVIAPGLMLTPPRSMAPATLLPNGKVLIAGGFDGTASIADANLFDPATGFWNSTAPLSTARRAPTAAFLPNGKVLVVGGYTGSSRVASADLYDPVTGTWSPTGSLSEARSGATATVLGNGKVLVIGGYGTGVATSAELYDPASGTWTPTGAPATPRDGHTATLLPDGRVLVTGGYTPSDATYHQTAEVYDPVTGLFGPAGMMSTGREGHTATLLPDGEVLVVGGRTSGRLASADLYDPVAGTWAPTGPLTGARDQHTATLLPNGKVLVVGGYNLGALNTTEVYDPVAGSWSAGPTPKAARYGHNATLLPDGRVLVAGGSDTAGMVARSELLASANGSWSATGSLSYTGGGGLAAALLPNGTVLVSGGSTNVTTYSTANSYDPAAGAFSSAGSMLAARSNHTLTLLLDGKVLGVGGSSTQVRTELYDPAAKSWSWTGSLTSARSRHTATLLPDGKVLVVGGTQNGSAGLASAEVYDPAAGTWSAAGTLSVGRFNHTATLLPGGKVLVAGGEGAGGSTAVVEVYDSVSGTWSTTGSLWTPHSRHTATLLPDGRVLVAGGWDSSPEANCELYDPASGTWSLADAMGYARSLHTAALLPNGRVLVMSGTNGGALSACELYDPSSGTWSNTSGASSRYAHTSASLADGRVLLVGGLASGTSPLSTAYVYDEGRGASSAWAPTLSGPLADTAAGAMVAVTGTRFTGISEAHSGSTLASSHNFPLFRFERQEAGEVAWMTLTAFTPTTASIRVPASVQPGTYWVRPFVNGISGTAQPLRVTSGSGDTTPPTAPGVPSGTPNPSNDDVVVTWAASTDAGSGLKDYAVEVSNDNKATWSAPVWVAGNSFTHTAPAQGSWWYRVKARDNALNTSAAVTSASAVLVDTTPPGEPGVPSGSPNPGAGSGITVTWAASSGDTGGSGLVGYTVEVSNDGMLSWDPPVSVAGTSWTQLSPAQGSYWYRVTALDGVGNAAAVVSGVAVVVDTTAPGAPGVPASTPNPSAGQDVTVSWAASSGDTGGSGLLGYTVEVSSDGKASWSAPVSVGTATSWTHASPAAGSYWYRVTARDAAGNATSSLSASAQVVTAAPPVNIIVGPQVNVAPYQVTLWWETDVTSTTEVHFGPTSQAAPAGYAKHSVWSTLAGTKHSRTLCNLAPGTYYYRVQSVGAGAQAAYSNEGTFVVPVPSGSPLDQFVLDDAVRAVANIGNTIYFGGDFTEVLPRRGAGLGFDATAGVVYDDLPMVAGQVNAVVADGQGGFYIGGDFQYVAGISRPYLAHILPDMGLDPGFSPVVDGRVDSLAMAGGTLYLGGSFSKVNGVTRGNAAALDASGALTAWNPNVAGPVSAMASSGSVIYLAGSFSFVNGATSRRNAAAVDATTGVSTAWNPNLNGSVNAIAASGSVVYLGGWFTTANGGTSRNYAAAVDSTTGLLTAWDPNPNNYVLSLAASGSSVYLGGTFTSLNGGTARNYAAAVDPTSGALMAWDAGVDNQVRSMALSGGTIYLAGGFLSVNGGTPRKRAAAVDAGTGAALPWDPRLAGFAANAIAVGGGKVWVGGEFASANPGTLRNRAAAIDGTTGALTAWNPDFSNAVQAMVASGNTLYIGGSFTKVNGATTRMFAAAVDATTGVATAWNPRVSSAVHALATAPGLIYLGGIFTTANGGTVRNRAAAVDEASGTLTSWNPDLDGSVYSLAVVGGTVYLGGAFTTANAGVARNRGAAVDATTGALSAWDPNLNGAVYALAANGSTIYVGGSFTTANGGTAARNAVGVDSVTGALTSWRPEPDGSVVALAHSGGTVLLAGGFSAVGGATRRTLGAVDASSGVALGWNPNAYRGPLAPSRNAAIVPVAGLGKVYFALEKVLGAGSTPQQGMLTLEVPTDGTSPTDPGAPVGAPSPTNGSVTVSWTASTDGGSGLQGYEVRLSSDGKATWSAPVSVATNSYTHASPTQGTWWYQVTAKDNAGNASAAVASTVGVVVDKTAPAGLSPVAGAPSPTSGDVTVSWSAASDTGGAGLKDYQVEGSSDGKATWSVLAASVGAGTTSWTHGSPAQGGWWYRVTAQDNAGNVFSSVSASAVVVDKTGPGAPGTPAGSPNPGNGANVLVTWAASSGDSGGAGLSGYTIEVSNDGMLSWNPPVSVAGTSWTQLSPAQGSYWYRVTALDYAGNGAAAVSAIPVIVDRTGPTGPGTPSGSPNPSNGADVTVSWAASTDAGGSGLKDYGVEISSNGGTSWSAPVYVATNSYTHAAPAQGSYLYRVTARDNVLNLSASATSASAVVDKTAPTNPGTPSGSPNAGNGADVTVSWTASSDGGGAGLRDYAIEISSNGGATWSAPVYATTNSYTHVAPVQGSYFYRVTARDNVLNASAPVTSAAAVVVDTSVPTSPGAPSGSPNPGNGADVTVTWAASSDAGAGLKDYAVEISSDGGTSWSAPVYVATNSYTHAAPAQGTYLYRVTARDLVLNTSAPGTSAVVVVDKTAPTGLDPVAGSPSFANGNVTATWAAAADTGGSALLDYQVQASSDGKVSWSAPVAVPLPTTSWTHVAPAEGSWWYRVTARDAAGNARVVDSAAPVLVDRVPPSDPSDIAGAPSPSNGDVTVTWTPSVDSSSGVKDYLVETSVDGKASWQSAGTASTPSYTQTAPGEGTYWYRVTARDQAGNPSAAVASAAPVVVDRTAPSAPGVPSGTPNPSTADVLVSWPAASDGGGAGLSGYILEISDDGMLSWSAPSSVAGVSWVHLAPAEGRYWYRVTARDQAANASAPSASVTAVVVDRTAPSAPAGLAASPNPSRADVTVTWSAASDGGAGLAAYLLETSSDGGTSWSATDVAATSYVHLGPAEGSWLYRVRARDAAGNLSPAVTSAPVVVDRTAPSTPGAPASSYDRASGNVTVTWTASTDGGGSGFAYRIERSADGGASWSAPATAGTPGYTDSGLQPGAYLYRVAAVDGAGNASASVATASAVVVDPSLPVAGQVRDGLAADVQFQQSTSILSANWSGFADPESGIARYEWAIGTTAGGTQVRAFVSVGDSTQATATGLTLVEGTTYYVSVRAINGAGWQAEARSNGVMVDGIPPTGGTVADGVASDLTTQASATTLAANWSGFSDGGSGLASYSWAIGTSAGATDVRGFTSVGTNTIADASSLSLVNGQAYFVTVRAYDRAGLYTDVCSDGVRVVVPFFSVRLSGPVSPTEQGEPHDLRLEVLDGLGATAAGYQGTLRLTSSDPLAQLPAEVVFTAADGGVKNLQRAVAFWAAGTHSLTATDSANPALTGSLGSIEVSEAIAPGIVREANGRGAVGVPYRYSAFGRVRAAGSTPIVFSSCGGPSGFSVASLDGSVRWTPAQAGVVSLCVAAQNAAGRGEYLFDVGVAASAPPGPRAVVDVAPPSGPAPLAVRLSGAASTVDPGAGSLMSLWDLGDGSAGASGRDVQHVYALSGGFRPTLTVWDAFGSSATATGSVTALGAGGQAPPSVRILASALEGQDSLTVELRADVAPGSAPIRGYLWHLRDGETATAPTTRATFGPGRWPVVLEVADASGLSSQDRVELVVRRGSSPPPECRARVTPAAGAAPLTARWSAEASTHDGASANLTWRFDDGTTSNLAEVQRVYGTPGAVVGRLRVEDGTGLACEDLVRLEVLSAARLRAPRILSGPVDAARCGASYPQEGPPARLSAVGESPLRWTLVEGPEGLTLDEATGAIRWSPDPSLSGPVRVTVAVENSVGRAERSFELPVECPSELAFEVVGCGCGSAQGGTWLPIALVGLLAGARRSRSRAGAQKGATPPGAGR